MCQERTRKEELEKAKQQQEQPKLSAHCKNMQVPNTCIKPPRQLSAIRGFNFYPEPVSVEGHNERAQGLIHMGRWLSHKAVM